MERASRTEQIGQTDSQPSDIDMEADAGIPFAFDRPDQLTRHIISIYFYNFELNARMMIFDMLRNFITMQLEIANINDVSDTDSCVAEGSSEKDSDTDNEAAACVDDDKTMAFANDAQEDNDVVVSPYTKRWIDAMDLFMQARSLWEEFGNRVPFVTFSQFYGTLSNADAKASWT